MGKDSQQQTGNLGIERAVLLYNIYIYIYMWLYLYVMIFSYGRSLVDFVIQIGM